MRVSFDIRSCLALIARGFLLLVLLDGFGSDDASLSIVNLELQLDLL